MIPGLTRSVRPTAATPGRVGLAEQAAAEQYGAVVEAGRSVAGWAERKKNRSDVLAASRAWRQLDAWRLEYLRGLPTRRKDLAATGLDPATGANVTGYERELTQFPDGIKAEYERVREGLSGDARAMLEQRYNLHAPGWAAQAVDALETLETEDITAEILALAAEDRASDAMELATQYEDRFEPVFFQNLLGKIADAGEAAQVAGAQGYLLDVARTQGWETADAALQNPEFLETFGLDLGEGGKLKTELGKWVSDEKTVAEGKRRAEIEAADDDLLARAWEGTLDLATIPGLVRENKVSASVATQAREIVLAAAKPEEAKDDLEALSQAYDWLRRVQEDPTRRGEGLAYVKSHAGQLPQSAREIVKALQLAGKAEDPAGRVGVKVADKMIDEWYDLEVFGEVGTPQAQKDYLAAKQNWARWVREHPQATDEEITAQQQTMRQQLVKPGWLKRLWKMMAAPTFGAEFTTMADLDRIEGPTAAAETPKFKRIDAEAEPLSLEEFYETVKSLPVDSDSQRQYYEKWARKWQ